jgi:uncharacterized membrane protein SpoIIM required for sporulation
MINNKILLIILAFIVVFILIKVEYKYHDCIDGKACLQMDKNVPINDNDKDQEQLDKIFKMVRGTYNYTRWRQALIIGIILALPIMYFVNKRLPTFWEWLVLATIIFFGVYFSYSWIHAHFYYPNNAQIEKNLLKLKDKLKQEKLSNLNNEPNVKPPEPTEEKAKKKKTKSP